MPLRDCTVGTPYLQQLSIYRTTLVPTALLLFTPPFAGLVWYTNAHLDGSIARLADWIWSEGIVSVVIKVWRPIIFGSPSAWGMIAAFAVVELVLMRLLPAKLSE